MLETAGDTDTLKAALERLPTPAVLLDDQASERFWVNGAFARLVGNPMRSFTLLDAPFTVGRNGRPVPREDVPFVRMARGQKIHGDEFELNLPDGQLIEAVAFARGGVMSIFDSGEQQARSNERLRFLAAAGEELAEAPSVGSLVAALQRLTVPRLAALTAVILLDEARRPSAISYYHIDPSKVRRIHELQRELRVDRFSLSNLSLDVLRSGESRVAGGWEAHSWPEGTDPSTIRYAQAIGRELQVNSTVTVPIKTRGRVMGLLIATDRRHRRYTPEDIRLLEDLARRAAPSLERARSLERHEQTSALLQHELLPASLPAVLGLTFDAVYQPGGDEALVGGDWYDAFKIPDGRVIVTIGDVTGRGVHAAALMSKVRQSISALSYYETDPVRLLDVSDKTLRRRQPDAIVTALVGIFDCNACTLTYAAAGHPSPYLRRADGNVLPLPSHGLPLGLRSEDEGSSMTVRLAAGDRVFFFTDGLIEATHDLDEGERRTTDAIRRAGSGAVAHFVRDTVLPNGSPDDVAILAASFRADGADAGAQTRLLELDFDARDVRMARESRVCAMQFLKNLGADEGLMMNAELVYGELISNVVRHAPGLVTVRVDWRAERPALCTVDRGSGYAKRSKLPDDPMSESGRGLFIVEALTTDFIVREAEGGGSDVCAVL